MKFAKKWVTLIPQIKSNNVGMTCGQNQLMWASPRIESINVSRRDFIKSPNVRRKKRISARILIYKCEQLQLTDRQHIMDYIARDNPVAALALDEKASDAMKVAFENAERKASAGFELAANNEIETQITILLKQYGSTSNESLKFAAEQIKETRSCAIKQYNSIRKPSKSELLETC